MPKSYPDSRTVYDRIVQFVKVYPKRIWVMADMNPRHAEEEYVTKITRCVKELGFVAVKLHPYLEAGPTQ